VILHQERGGEDQQQKEQIPQITETLKHSDPVTSVGGCLWNCYLTIHDPAFQITGDLLQF